MSKPGVFKLSSESFNFVFSNMPVLRAHLSIVFPLVLLMAIGQQVCILTGQPWIKNLLLLPIFYLFACFVLSWHRTSLEGANIAHRINPLRISATDFKFILLYGALVATYSILNYAVDAGFQQVFLSAGERYHAVFNLLALILQVVGLYYFVKISFLLPAKSVGVTLGIKDAMRASKGLVWPFLGTILILTILFAIGFVLYAFVSGIIVTVAAGDAEIQKVQMGIVGFFLSIPVFAAVFVLIALYTTALSKAYQWGIQNNPH